MTEKGLLQTLYRTVLEQFHLKVSQFLKNVPIIIIVIQDTYGYVIDENPDYYEVSSTALCCKFALIMVHKVFWNTLYYDSLCG